ncbi:MAG: histidine phosphatase family protein [Bacteroidota bacterium]
MKKLFLARHGKSSLGDPDAADHERALLTVGVNNTKKIQQYIGKKEISFDLIISSYALRALETAKLLAEAADYPQNAIKIDHRMYEAVEDVIYRVLAEIDDTKENVLLVGHNPTLTQFVNIYLKPRIDNMPTSGFVCISFNTESWNEIPLSKGTVDFMVTPQTL